MPASDFAMFLRDPDPPVVPGGPPPPAPNPNPTPPPAGTIVNNGERSERETELEAELETVRQSLATESAEKKQREVKIAELEDALSRLRGEPADQDAGWKAGLFNL